MFKFLDNIFPSNLPGEIVDLLMCSLSKLPQEKYGRFVNQIEKGLLKYQRDSDVNHQVFRNYVYFTYDSKISRIFFDPGGRFSRVHDIVFADKNGTSSSKFAIYFSHGLVCGYAFERDRDFDADLGTVDVSQASFEYLDEEDPNIRKLLSAADEHLVNWSDVYEIDLAGQTIYHLRDIGDGDFVGMDQNGTFLRVTHDPPEVHLLEGTLEEIFAKFCA